MSLKDKFKKLLSPRNILIILLVLCVIVVAYILMTNYSGKNEKIYSVKEVISQSDRLKKSGEQITVKGYYTRFDVNIAQISDSAVTPGGSPSQDTLLVDYSGVQNANLKEGSIYNFSGVLQDNPLNPNQVILIASEIKPS